MIPVHPDPVALVTGASRGIGRAAAIALAQEGYRLALVARTRQALQETAEMLAGESMILAADVGDYEQAESAVQAAVEGFGRLDAMIHVAGVAPLKSIEETTPALWRTTLDTNLSAAFYLARLAWPHLKLAATQRGHAAIVNISSLASRDPFPGFAAYGAAKAGLNLFGLAAAREGRPDNIFVHTIAPGAVETEMFRGIMTPQQFPPEKTLSADEVAEVIVRCAVGQLRHTTGEVIYLHKTV